MQPQTLFDHDDPILRALTERRTVPDCEPWSVSPWVAMSAMQKGIRRNHVGLALWAAATLLKSDPAKLWRRLAGIVVEDIGLADLDCVALVMAGTSGKKFREQFGGDWPVASLLVTRMCAAPACRVADNLFLTVSHHHELADLRASLARETVPQHLARLQTRNALLGSSLAALFASGVRWSGHVTGRTSNAKAVFDAMRLAGVEPNIVDLCDQGFRRTREALPMMMALASLALPGGILSVADDQFPPVVMGRSGIPTYCYDAFSWEGKAALSRFLKRDTETGRWLRRHVSANRRLAVLAGGLFRVEGGLVCQRLIWPCAQTLRWLADSGYHGMELADPAGFLDMIRADLPKLDEERANVS